MRVGDGHAFVKNFYGKYGLHWVSQHVIAVVLPRKTYLFQGAPTNAFNQVEAYMVLLLCDCEGDATTACKTRQTMKQ